jgi:hypothetical protein
MGAKLTAKQFQCLRDMERLESVSPWAYGSTTIASLKRHGLIELHNNDGRPGLRLYTLTDAGRAARTEVSQ